MECPKKRMVRSARQRAARTGIPCTITSEDFEIPEYCPVLGIPLRHARGSKGPSPNSPTLDKMIPSRGYVPGNVIVVSNRANRAKSDLSPDELRALADFYGASR